MYFLQYCHLHISHDSPKVPLCGNQQQQLLQQQQQKTEEKAASATPILPYVIGLFVRLLFKIDMK